MQNIRIILSFLGLLLIGCNAPNHSEFKENLPGYWEIKEVAFPDGEKKEYDMNIIMDHIELNGEKGKRTKVSPGLDGSFTTNEMSEDFIIKIENDSLYMFYTTPFDEWKEVVLDAQEDLLKIKNRDNKIYTYKRFSAETILNEE